MPKDTPWTVQASFPAEENATWWADQVTGDYPELEVHRAGPVVTVRDIPDHKLMAGLTIQAYTRYNAEEVLERPAEGRTRAVARPVR